MNNSNRLYIVIILCWFISQGITCDRGRGIVNCPNFKMDTVSIPFDIVNQAAMCHIQDTIKIFSKISDTIISRSAVSFVTPVNKVFAYIQTYKVVPWGTSYGLNYANNEFNYFISTGTFQNVGQAGYNIMYERSEPYNTAALSVNPGDSGLYIFTVWLENESYGSSLDFYNGNDHCTAFRGIPNIGVLKQNRQYWDSLGVSSLTLINSGAGPINKNDENYFFVKVVP